MHHLTDEILRAKSEDGWLRLMAVRTTALTESARRRHRTSPVATAALGRTLTGCLMLGELSLAGLGRLTLRLIGDGPLRAVIADCDGHGRVRGYVAQPAVEVPLRADGKLAVGQALGHGQLVVSQDLADGQVYSSSVPLRSGEIGEDLAAYLDASDQIPSAVGLGVRLDKSGRVVGAGGWLVQLMPGGEDHLELIEASTATLPSISQLMADGEELSAVLQRLAPGLVVEPLSCHPVSFGCTCSLTRVRRAVAMLGADTLAEMVASGQPVETRCHFCHRRFRIPVAAFALSAAP